MKQLHHLRPVAWLLLVCLGQAACSDSSGSAPPDGFPSTADRPDNLDAASGSSIPQMDMDSPDILQIRPAQDAGAEAVFGDSLSGSVDAASLPDSAQGSVESGSSHCGVSGQAASQHDVYFHLRNRGQRPVYIFRACGALALGVTSCLSGYVDDLGPSDRCMCDGVDAGSRCVPCSPEVPYQLPENGFRAVRWIGVRPLSPSCRATSESFPAGLYRAAFWVFDDMPVTNPVKADARMVTVMFALGPPSNVVNVDVSRPPAKPIDAGPD